MTLEKLRSVGIGHPDEERRWYLALFEDAPEACVITDEEGVVRDANRAAAALLHQPRPVLTGRPLAAHVAADDRGAYLQALRGGYRQRGGDTPGRDDWWLRLEPRDAPTVHATVTVTRVDEHAVPGGGTALRWTVRDISDRVEVHRRIRELQAALERHTAELQRTERARALAEERSRQLQHALDSRVVIEQAKGRLMERTGLDADTAFAVLRRQARSTGRKLRAVATQIADGDPAAVAQRR